MRISSIQQICYRNEYQPIRKQEKPIEQEYRQINELPNFYYPYNINFGIANSGKLKMLFKKGMPCMYNGLDMIDPGKVQNLMKAKAFDLPVKDLFPILEQFEKSFPPSIEKNVYYLLKDSARDYPDKNIRELLQKMSPTFKRILRKIQAPIFQRLTEKSQELPDEYKYKFKQLMVETDTKLQERPVAIPFSTREFKYKLQKIRDDLKSHKNPKAVKVANKLLSEAERFYKETTPKTTPRQKEIISFMEIILKRSVLSDYPPTKELLENSKDKLDLKKTKIPFNRRSFIYDLYKIIDKLPDQKLKDELISIATLLPASSNSTSAYIVKFAPQSCEKIVYRLLVPFFATVEHIHPHSLGGVDEMSNFGGASSRENTQRGNCNFTDQLIKRPETRKNCQKYLDRAIELAKNGTFDSINLNKKYIEDFKNTIKKESKGALILDTSKLYLTGD